VQWPNRPGAGGEGITTLPGILPNRPGQGGGGTQWPNRPDWSNRPGAGGGGTQWPNRPDWNNRPDWANRPGGGGSGTQWPNRPDWNNRPDWANRPGWNRPGWPNNNDIGNWLNRPGNNWANRNPNRWNNWSNLGNNYNTIIANRGDTIRNTVVNSTTNYANYGNMFTPGWYGNAWRGSYFTGYPAATPYYWWNAATAANLTGWLGWNATAQPTYYNYGSNVDYSGGTVYVDQQPVASADSYVDQAMQLAQAGIQALSTVAANNAAAAAAAQPINDRPPPAPGAYTGPEWMPLGVFAVAPDEKTEPTIFLQLALTKDGVIGGTYENTSTGQKQNIAGKVDKASQRAAWSTSDGAQEMVMEAGIFNLTQPQAPVLVHWGKEQTQTWLMVRMDPPKQQ
jgi:hypothetical protein